MSLLSVGLTQLRHWHITWTPMSTSGSAMEGRDIGRQREVGKQEHNPLPLGLREVKVFLLLELATKVAPGTCLDFPKCMEVPKHSRVSSCHGVDS